MPIIDKIKEVFSSDKSNSSSTATGARSTDAHHAQPAVASTTSAPTDAAVKSSTTATPAAAAGTASASSGVAFDAAKVKVIFVLGGPGAGKGTQCERLVRDYGFKHLSAGDLLRAEQNREGSTYGEMIKDHIRQGQIVPMEVTVKLLENAMHDTLKSPPTFTSGSSKNLEQEWTAGKGRFLIDGFPRKMDQALKFDESVCKSSFVLFITTTEEVMLDRLLERGKTSGRDDDNRESITKRFKTFIETSMPVVDYYRKRDLVEEVDSSPSPDEVYANVQKIMDKRLGTSSANAASSAAPVTHTPASSSAAPSAVSGHGETSTLPPLSGGQAAPVLGAAI